MTRCMLRWTGPGTTCSAISSSSSAPASRFCRSAIWAPPGASARPRASRARNPVFLGQALLFIGLFIVLPSLVQAGLTLALLIAIRLQVAIEERVLTASLGQPYLAYRARVRRWLGVTRQLPA